VTALRVQAQRQQRKLEEPSAAKLEEQSAAKLEEQRGLLGQMQAAARALEAEARGDVGRCGEI
jgi:hypothetical protein